MKWSVVKRKLARVDRAIDQAIAKAEIPGAVVLARMPKHGERLEHFSARGFAVLRPERIPMARETVFDLASLTKPIVTTTGILLLASDGALGIDDPVSKFLPDFAERGKEAVTLRHLLTHSSGLKPWRGFHDLLLDKERRTGERLIGTPAAREFVLERVLRSALVHEPGAAAVYGDLDFIVLGAVVEAVARRPLDEFAAERVFGPLGMRETFFVRTGDGVPGLPEAVRRRVAATENCPWRGRVVWGEVHDPNASVMGGVAGARGPVFERGRRHEVCADDPRRLARPQRSAPARIASGFSYPATPAPRLGLDARLGHTDARRIRLGPALRRELGGTPGIHRHVALDRSRARGDRGDAHEPRASSRRTIPAPTVWTARRAPIRSARISTISARRVHSTARSSTRRRRS